MRGMILRSFLLCIGTVLAAPHLPQTIDCPNSDIHVFVNQSAVDRKEYTFVDWNAANLQDCVEKCFGNHFCYSIRFDSSLDHNCALYYFAAYNCSNQALTKASTIDYKGGSITLDCIRCPGRGDFVTAPPFSSVGDQTIVSETAVLARGKNIKGTATEITHNSEHDGVPHGEAEGREEGGKGGIEGSGEAPTEGVQSEGEKIGEEPTASTETTLTGDNPSEGGATSVPSAESSDATTENPEEATGATVTPGTGAQPGEAGPTSAESGNGKTSSVEGSGEGEEAATHITGESKGEAELIGKSSGEGTPSAGSSRAPGTAPPQVEGSGIEGSGESPVISGQEEEEPVKVEVETTTSWNGNTERPRVCSGSLRFVPSSVVDLDTVQLLINETKANSPAECAKICYENNCGFAYYEPSTFICQYMANTEEMVDSSTCPADLKDAKYQAEFRTDVASTLTCVVCAKESEVDHDKPALRPISTPRRGSYPACIISFQAAEGDHSSFPFYKSVQVHGVNECARHCFIGECSQSVYNPKTKECRLGSNPKDTCSNLPLIQRVAAPSEEVLLQCFRCIPEDLIGVKGTVSETTGYREPPTAAESIDEAAATSNKEKEQAIAAATPHPEMTTETTVTEEATTEAAETELPTTEATEETTTTIAGSGDEIEVAEPLPEGVTEKPIEETTTATESTTTEEETTTMGGEEVEIEEASGQEETTTSAGEAVTSSSTGYESEEVEGAGEKATTTSEVEGSGEEEGATTAAPSGGEGKGEATTAAGEGEEATTAAGVGQGEEKGEEATTATTEGEATTAAAEGEETTTVGGEEGETTETPEGTSTLSHEEAATTEEGAEGSTVTAQEGARSEGAGEMAKAIEANDQPLILASEDIDFGKSCVIKFQAAPFSARPSSLTALFEKSFPVDSIELCATRCFQDGCSSAKYEPEGKMCHLAYDDKSICDRTELQLRMKEVDGDTWIHCVNCYPEKSVVKDVLGAPLDKNATGEEKEKSMLDKVIGAVSDVAHTVAEKVTGENPDAILRHGCIVNFQTSPSTETSEAVEYLPPFKTRYAHRCATKCFQEGCAAARFNPTTNECSLGYGRFVKCNNSPLQTAALNIKETITIHCMSCIHHKPGEGGVDLVVLSPDDARIHLSESQDVPSEEVEGSGAEVTVSPGAGGESTTEGAKGAEATTATSETEEGTTVAGEGSGAETTVAGEGEGESTTAPSAVSTEGTVESTTEGEVGGGTLGEEGSGALEKEGKGRILEVPLASGADGVETPAGVKEDETASGKVQLTGEKDENGKFKVELPTGFSIDSGVGKVHVEGKMPEEEKGEGATGSVGEGEKPAETKTGAGESTTVSGTEAGESTTPSGTETKAGAGESTTASGAEPGAGTGESTTAVGTEAGESTTPSGTEAGESTTPSGTETKAGAGESTTVSETEGGESTTPSGTETKAGAAGESTTASGAETGAGTGESTTAVGTEAESTTTSGAESSTEFPLETSSTSVEGTGLTTGEEGGEVTTASTEETSSAATPSESSTAAEETSTPGVEASSTDGHGIMHPAKEIDHAPLHPLGEEVEVGSAETTGKEEEVTPSSTDSTATIEETTTKKEEEEGPAFVQGSSEDEEEKEGLAISEDHKQREGQVEKALSTDKPTGTDESTTEKPAAGESMDTEKTTVSGVEEGEAGKSTVAPVGGESTTPSTAESSTASTESTTVSTPIGELDAMAATDGETAATPTTATPSESTTAAVSEEAATTTAASEDLQHREGILEKALATAHPAMTTKEGEEGSSTPSSASADTSSSTVEPTAESTVASTTEGTVAEGETTVAASTEGSVATESGETTVAASTEGTTVATEGGESSTVGGPTEGTVSAVVPMDGMAASIDEKAKDETKEVEEEMAQKGEVKETGEKGAPVASLSGSSTVAPSDVTGSTSSDIPSTTVPSRADLAKSQHHEKGGAEFGQTGQRGTEETEVTEEPAVKGEVKGSGTKGASTSSSIDISSTAAPSDTEGSTATADAASGELTTSSSLDGGVGGLAREGEIESTTSSVSESTPESTTGASEGSSTVSSVEDTESSTSSGEGTESTTASESHDTTSISNEEIVQKALANANEKAGVVPSPADLAKSQHHEEGGAEFGQTGQRGTEEKEVGAQEDEIKSTTISSVEATTGESLDGGIDRALSAIGEKTTTEPPVQAVKDLLDALASGDFDRTLLAKKANGTGSEAEKILKGQTQITDVATPINQKHEGQTFFEHDHNVDITTLHAIDDSVVTVPSPQGISKNCDGGRLEFQFVPAGSLPRLNVTNDVPARTPADCARRCHETKGCTTAGFIPTPSADIANGVCLLTSDDEVCISRDDAVPQHASVTAFVISCIRCTRCSYSLSHMTLSSSTAKFQHISTVTTIGQCAEVCNDKKCVFAQYDATTNTCALSMEASHESGCNKVESSIAVKGAYPVRLECVQCRE